MTQVVFHTQINLNHKIIKANKRNTEKYLFYMLLWMADDFYNDLTTPPPRLVQDKIET